MQGTTSMVKDTSHSKANGKTGQAKFAYWLNRVEESADDLFNLMPS